MEYKKLLTRVRLINWHFMENETISMNGSTLVSGENTAGKSTILDAIQLVITTNTRKFNTAANEKGNRNLKGYVRCKVGNEGETYIRKNVVIANVCLEFYEEKTGKYFVIGVHMTSTDEESAVSTKWYMEEVRLEALSFLNGNIPATQSEFRVNGKKIKYIDQKYAAMEKIKYRLGHLEDRFFDVIPKSLAFKPMDNVKDFINKFILTDEKIDVESLRTNIENLAELESMMEKTNNQLKMLTEIVARYDEIVKKDKDILINEFLIDIANIDYHKEEIKKLEYEIEQSEQYLEGNKQQITQLEEELNQYNEKMVALSVAANSNEAHNLAEEIRRRIRDLDIKIYNREQEVIKLNKDIQNISVILRMLQAREITVISKLDFDTLATSIEPNEKKNNFQKLSVNLQKELEEIQREDTLMQERMTQLNGVISDIQLKLQELENRKLQFPHNTMLLKNAIEKEYTKSGIQSKVYIVAELLEITDETWKNAVEGYFNTQKFNLIVEPEYYNVALEVYRKNQGRIHSAGIVNTRKIKLEEQVNNKSLAYVVKSENRYAKAYANYVLGRVIRCSSVKELEEYKIAITADCMLYQGYVVRNLDKETYKNPYIGQYAYRIQLSNTRKEFEEYVAQRASLRKEKEEIADILNAGKNFNPQYMSTYIDAPYYLNQNINQRNLEENELKAADNDPTYLELKIQIERLAEQIKETSEQNKKLTRESERLLLRKEQKLERIVVARDEQKWLEETHFQKADLHNDCKMAAEVKYKDNRKKKTSKDIVENFAPQKSQFLKERDVLLNGNQGLRSLQEQFNNKHERDFLRGIEGMNDYINAKHEIEKYELVRFEEKMKKAKEDCEQIFKQDFLAKMRNNIENARNEFKNLNKSLENIYYGEDSYRFKIHYNKKKESLYRMIVSEDNIGGYNLFSQNFEMQYKDEMNDLFAKLTTKDDKGEKLILEYTDYRSYLDYDIEIHKKNGTIQKFSSIYGEKSGSETQVPYYVAIAASFKQLYRYGNTVRLMLLDEAFDKMDDERIISMVQFFNQVGLQVIMATPPAKIEVIGEHVDTILTAIRVGNQSIVEEYDL